MAVSKPMLTDEFGNHYRLESCRLKSDSKLLEQEVFSLKFCVISDETPDSTETTESVKLVG